MNQPIADLLFNPAIYQFNWFSVPLLIVAIILTLIGFFVLKQHPQARTNQTFFYLCLGLTMWLVGYAWMYSIIDAASALWLYRHFTFLGVVLIAINVYAFSVMWLELWEQQKWLVIAGYLFSFSCYFLAWNSPLVVPFVEKYFWGYYSRYGPVGVLFFASFVFYFFAAFGNFIYRLRYPIPTVQKRQIYPVIAAFCFAITGCVDFIPKIVHAEIFPFGFLSAFFWIMGMAYAIVTYKVMDIETVIHKTLLWVTTSALYVVPIGIIAYFAKDWLVGLSPTVFALTAFVFFLAFIPHVQIVQPKIDQLFQRRKYDLNRIVAQFSQELVHLKSLEDLSEHILATVKRTLYPDALNLLLWDTVKGKSLVFKPGKRALEISTHAFNDLFLFLGSYNAVILKEFIHIDPRLIPQADSFERLFDEFEAIVCAPLVMEDQLIGVLMLGEKENLKEYSGTEIGFLSDLRGSAAIAISNSLRLIAMQANLRKWNEELEKQVKERTRELKDAQSQLIQAEKLATIGTLAGGVAHEINNPLAAIMTNAQMLLMEELSGDAKESIELIEEATKRCREIVQKLMKYSRKAPEEKTHEALDINEVIRQTIEFLKYQLQQENLKVATKLEAKSRIQGSHNELSQVFTNLLMNAKDALSGNQNGSMIEVLTKETGGEVIAEVKDNGCGIPEEKLIKIFDPFFTTKDVGKGTGLGLSIVQKIMIDHGGRIDVRSKAGEGTSFLLFFPKNT